MSGDATEVGSIIAYLTLNRGDWSAGVRDTERDADRLGRLSPSIRIQTNTGEVLGQLALVHAAERRVGTEADKAKPFVLNLWAALAAAGPAAVPVAAVAGGALLGLLPVLAAVGLGIAGIKNQMKAGAVQGTEFADEVNTVKGELAQLEQTAASGIMGGLNQAMRQSQPLFGALNSDIAETSTQIGGIIGDAGPALLSLLHQLEPLFSTVGQVVEDGANKLEHWARSGKGLTGFVSYVQAELPEVEQLLGGVITLVSHLMQASAGPGAALLHDLNLLVSALDAIPVGVLQTAIPLVISLYAAIKTGQGVAAAARAVDKAIASIGNTLALTGPRAATAAAQQNAAALSVEATAAQEAAAVAASQAAMAAAAAEAAVEIAATTEGTSSVLAAGAAAAAESAIEEAAAFQAAAEAAAAAAAQISASAEAAAAASSEAGAAASVGWASMLGPVGGLVAGVALLSTFLIGNAHASQQAAQAQDSYADAVRKSSDASAAATRQQTVDNLGKSGTLALLEKLHAANQLTSVSTVDLVDAVNGSADAYDRVMKALQSSPGAIVSNLFNGSTDAIGKFRDGLKAALEQQKLLTDSQRANQQATDGGAAAASNAAHQLGVTKNALLDAQVAAEKNTEQTKSQTLAMQLESNAAGLLNQALQTLAGQNLSVAQAQTQVGQSLHGVIDAMHQNGTAIKGDSVAALANQEAIQGNVSAARQLAQAVAQRTGSNDKAIVSYRQSKKELEDQLKAQGKLTPAVKAYIDRLYDVKGISDYLAKHPTKVDVDAGPAGRKVDVLQARINSIRQGRVPGIDADTAAGKRKIAELQAQIDALHGKLVPISVVGAGTKGGDPRLRFADGGTVHGPGGPKSDTVPAMLSPGEEVTPEPQASKHRALLKAIAADQVPGFAAGGTVYRVGSGYGYGGQYFAKRKDAEQAARDAAHQAAAAGVAGIQPGSDLLSALASAAATQAATAQQVHDAAAALRKAAHDAGVSHAALAATAVLQGRLVADAEQRDKVRAQLGTAPTAPTAYDQLAAAQQQYSSDRDRYRQAALGFDITAAAAAQPVTSTSKVGGATITSTTPGSSAVTVSSILAGGAADVAQVREFDQLIHKLVAEGLDADYVAEIAGKGPTPEAVATARALAKATPAEVRKLNGQQAQRKSAANDLGTYLAKQYDQAGITAAKSLISSLKAQETTLTVEMENIAARMANRFWRQLGNGPTGAKGKKHGPKKPTVQVHVHPAAGHSEHTIGKVAADEVLWRLKR